MSGYVETYAGLERGRDETDGLEGPSPALESIRQVIREELSAAASPLVTTAEAMALTKHAKERAFHQWTSAHGIKQARRGVYSREAIVRALTKSLRKGKRA